MTIERLVPITIITTIILSPLLHFSGATALPEPGAGQPGSRPRLLRPDVPRPSARHTVPQGPAQEQSHAEPAAVLHLPRLHRVHFQVSHACLSVCSKEGREESGRGQGGGWGGDEEMGVGESCSFATCIVSRCSQ